MGGVIRVNYDGIIYIAIRDTNVTIKLKYIESILIVSGLF